MEEFLEGYGTLRLSEPTTLCDIANTLGYVQKITPVVEKVERLLEEYEYYSGTYDEEGRFKAGCLRLRGSYTSVFMDKPPMEKDWRGEMRPIAGTDESTEQSVRTVLGYQLWDAHVDYGRIVPELSEKLRALREELREEKGET